MNDALYESIQHARRNAEQVARDALTKRNQAEADRDIARAQRDELLTALQSCLAFWNCPPTGAGCDAQRKRALSDIITQAQAAISRATAP